MKEQRRKKKKKKKKKNVKYMHISLLFTSRGVVPFLSLNNDMLSCFRWDESTYTYFHPERIMFSDFTLGVDFGGR